MLEALPGARQKTVGIDKNYDTTALVANSRAASVILHVPQNINAHRWWRFSQVVRQPIDETNGWIKEVGGMARTKLRALNQVEWMFVFKATAYNLI